MVSFGGGSQRRSAQQVFELAAGGRVNLSDRNTGMPKEAIALGAAERIVPLRAIRGEIQRLRVGA